MENNENSKLNAADKDFAALKKELNARKKEGVTRGALITGIIAFVLLLVAGIFANSLFKQERNRQMALVENQKNLFNKQLTSRDSLINDWLVTFDQIEKDMNLIKEKENVVTFKSSDSELSTNKKAQILDDIKFINTLLENNKKKIASLNAQLKNSGSTIKGLQERIASLESSIKQYESDVADLKSTLVKKDFEIGQLNTAKSNLETTVAQKDTVINNQVSTLNKAYLASGTFKELKVKGILAKEGGFLGLGRKESLVQDVNDNLFSKIDIRETKTIPVNSKNAKLITDHPSGSYAMIHDNANMIAYIEIKDPDSFWKMSKYAVVEIIK